MGFFAGKFIKAELTSAHTCVQIFFYKKLKYSGASQQFYVISFSGALHTVLESWPCLSLIVMALSIFELSQSLSLRSSSS